MFAAVAGFIISESTWVWIAGLALVVAGGVFAEWVFRRVATPETIRADLEGPSS
jgi:hypothetical protein